MTEPDERERDVVITEHGAQLIFTLRTERAREWVAKHVPISQRAYETALVTEHRNAAELADQMTAAGLYVTGA